MEQKVERCRVVTSCSHLDTNTSVLVSNGHHYFENYSHKLLSHWLRTAAQGANKGYDKMTYQLTSNLLF